MIPRWILKKHMILPKIDETWRKEADEDARRGIVEETGIEDEGNEPDNGEDNQYAVPC